MLLLGDLYFELASYALIVFTYSFLEYTAISTSPS